MYRIIGCNPVLKCTKFAIIKIVSGAYLLNAGHGAGKEPFQRTAHSSLSLFVNRLSLFSVTTLRGINEIPFHSPKIVTGLPPLNASSCQNDPKAPSISTTDLFLSTMHLRSFV